MWAQDVLQMKVQPKLVLELPSNSPFASGISSREHHFGLFTAGLSLGSMSTSADALCPMSKGRCA